jgi:hypothetical protein
MKNRWLFGLIYLTLLAGFFDAFWGTTTVKYQLFDYGFLSMAGTLLSILWGISLFFFIGIPKTRRQWLNFAALLCLFVVIWGIGTHASLLMAVALGKLPLQTYLSIQYDFNNLFGIPITLDLSEIFAVNYIFFALFLLLKPKRISDIDKIN